MTTCDATTNARSVGRRLLGDVVLPGVTLVAALLVLGCGPAPKGVEIETDWCSGSLPQGSSDSRDDGTRSNGCGSPRGLEIPQELAVDILVVVDDSATMAEEQARLSASLGALITAMEQPDVDIDYRIGFTTTDSGHVRCADTTPESGALRLSACTTRPWEFTNRQGTEDHYDTSCAASCPSYVEGEGFTIDDLRPTRTDRDETPRPRPWIERTAGVTNLPPGVTTVDAVACAAPQGIDGCGFESHLESMYLAFARSQDEADPQFDFRRYGALLAVLHVTDEDDCSMNPVWDEEVASLAIPEANRVFWENPQGKPTSSICWNAGVSCVGDPSGYDTCEPADKGLGAPWQLPYDNDPLAGGKWPTVILGDLALPQYNAVLFPVKKYVDRLEEADLSDTYGSSRRMRFTLIAGAPVGYASNRRLEIEYADADDVAVQEEFGIGYGCTAEGTNAAPPVRLRAVAEAFEVDEARNIHSVCADDYDAPITALAEAIREAWNPPCYPGCVLDRDPETPQLEPFCDVFQQVPGRAKAIMPSCDGRTLPEGEVACFYYLESQDADFAEECASRGYNLQIEVVRDPSAPKEPGTYVEAECRWAESPFEDCPGFMGI